jgi:hypothetical protein
MTPGWALPGSPRVGIDETFQQDDLHGANADTTRKLVPMPTDLQRPCVRVDRVFLVVVVLLVTSWALFVGSVVSLLGSR